MQIGGKEAVPPPGMQRRLTREPHVTEVGHRSAESEGLFNSSLRSPPLSQRATERVCPLSAAGPRSGTRGDFTKTQNNLEEKRDRELKIGIESKIQRLFLLSEFQERVILTGDE